MGNKSDSGEKLTSISSNGRKKITYKISNASNKGKKPSDINTFIYG